MASMTAIKSIAPPPKPLSASVSVMAVKPISAKVCQAASLTPDSELMIALRFSKLYSLMRYLLTESANCFCSCVSSKFIDFSHKPKLILAMMLR